LLNSRFVTANTATAEVALQLHFVDQISSDVS